MPRVRALPANPANAGHPRDGSRDPRSVRVVQSFAAGKHWVPGQPDLGREERRIDAIAANPVARRLCLGGKGGNKGRGMRRGAGKADRCRGGQAGENKDKAEWFHAAADSLTRRQPQPRIAGRS
jgi:hypothetical protein